MRRKAIVALLILGASLLWLVVPRHGLTQSTGLRRITNTTEEGVNLNPSISGDGRIVAFESTEDVAGAGSADHFRAIRANVGLDPATFFQMAGSRAVAPAISQDGSRIAFASKEDPLGANPDGNSEIFLFDGSRLIQITSTSPGSLSDRVANGNFQPSISDDGRFIAFSSNRDLASQNGDGNFELFVYDTTASTFSQLTNSDGIVGFTDAKISGDGSTVASIRDNGTTASATRDLVEQSRAAGSSITVLAASVQSLAMTYGRAISDDGQRVVYSAPTATNTTQVFMFDGRTGGVNRQITSLGARVNEVPLHPTISGDGSRIAFAARRSVSGTPTNSDGSVELYVYDLPTATFSKITNAPSSATADIVSSMNDDGSVIAFNFPRILSGAVNTGGTENNSETYVTSPPVRPANGSLTAILNDASFGHEPSTVKAVAPNSIAAAQGSNLATTTLQSQKLADGTFPTNVGGTRVTVNGRAAQIFFVSPTQVNFLVPPQTEIGAADVIVTNAENFPSRGSVPTLRAAPGIFTKTGDGIGEGVTLNSDTQQEGPFDPTNGNLRLSIFTTGARNAIQTSVSIGGRLINAESVIPSSSMPGLDEVHVRVPADLRGAGTVNLSVISDGRESNPVNVNLLGDSSRAIFVNEVLADPPTGTDGDANHDGVRDGTQDEFVELVNGSTSETIGMSGWTLKTRATGSTTETTRFTFPAGASLPAGESAVIFGGGTFNPTDPVFGCAQIFKAASASSGLSLTNGGLTILVRDAAGNLIAQFSYGGSTGLDGNSAQSLTRSPDITGSFVLHTSAANANGRKFSPGLRTDGTPFGNCPGKLTSVSLTPASTSIVVGQSTQFTARALDQYGRTMPGLTITFASDNANVATIDSTSTSAGVATSTVKSKNPGATHITATATDGSTAVNSAQSTLTVTGPSLSINDVSHNEGNSGTTTYTFTVSLTTPAPTPVTFDIATQDSTATVADNDYLARNLTAQNIPAGQQTYTFDVAVNGDQNIEPTETFFVNVTNVNGASVTKSQGVGTIFSDDIPLLSVNYVSLNEGNSGTTTFTVTVTSSLPAPSGGVTFDIATADGTATAGSDYVARSLTAQTIPAGQTSYTFNVSVNGDTLVEPNETFLVNISNVSSNAGVSDGQGQGTIQNDDTPQLVISQLYGGGGNTGATFKNDFIEVFNAGATTIDFSVTNYSLQYASSTSNFGSTSSANKFDLSAGTIAPHQYFLVKLDGGANGADLPAADATGAISMASSAGKIALVKSTTALSATTCPTDLSIADLVGYGSGPNCFEGSATAPAPGNTAADFRKLGGCQDTNDNAADFLTATPNPRNTSSPLNDCASADLAITKSDSPDPVISGQNVTYTIVVTNNGPATAQSVVVTDNLPSDVTFVSCNSTGSGVCGGTGNNRTISFSSLAVDGSETITLVATVTAAGGATISNTASVSSSTSDSISGNNSATATTTVNNPTFADLAITKSDSPDPVYPTQTLTYTLVVTNNGPDTAQSVVVSDPLPASVTFVDCTSNQSGVCGGTSTTPTVSFSSLANGVTATITIHVTVNSNVTAATVISNTASVTSATADPNSSNNSAPEATTVQELNSGDLLISEFRTRGPSGASDEFVEIYNPSTSTLVIGGLKIRASNGSGTISDRVTITAGTTLGPGCHYLIANSSATGYSGATPANQTYTTGISDDGGIAITRNNGSTIIDQVGMSSGSAYKEATTLAPLTNSVEQSYERKPGGSFGNGIDTNDNSADFFLNASSSNPQNSSSGCLNTASADLSISNSDAPDPVTIGQNITYTITVLNNGAATAQTVSVTDNLPAEVSFVSCSATSGAVCGGSGNNRTVSLTSLASGASFTVTIVATANGPHRSTASDTASVSSATTDANSSNNSATANTLMQEPTPSLSINDVIVTEGNSGTTNAVFNVTLSPSSAQTVTVNYATSSASPATAAAGTDYVTTSGTLTFNPGDTTKPITVQVNGDTANEAICETFFVNLTSPTNATISDTQGQGGITDDDGTKLVISQIYGAGGNSGATYTNDFIEIFNRGNVAVSLNGLSVQYSAATSTSGSFSVTTLPNVNLQPGQYFLIQESGGANGSPLPTADATGTIAMAATAGKVALVNGTSALSAVGCPSGATILDFVGYGTTANCREGSSTSDNAGAPGTTTSDQRKLSGCQDTGNNNNDFAVATPAPRNTSTALSACSCSTSYSSLMIFSGGSWKDSLARLTVDRAPLWRRLLFNQ